MTELRPFQLEGARMIRQFGGRALVADEMGLGKTIEALFWIKKIASRRPAVIVTLATVKYAWQMEAHLLGMHAEVLEGNCPKKQKKLPADIVVLNYDILHSWLPCLIRSNPQCVVFDECHYLRTPGARRTKSGKLLALNIPSVIGLSGTPMTNRPIELWSVLNIIRPELFPDRMEFAWRYCEPKYTPWGWQFKGAKRKEELRKILLDTCMIRRLKKDVAPELPNKTRQIIPFRLKSYVEYNEARFDFINWLRKQSPAKANRAEKSKALTKVGYLLRLVAKLKLQFIEQWIREFFEAHPGRKLVALTMNTFVIDHLKGIFPNNVIVNGQVKGRKRAESIRKFQTNPSIQLFIGNWRAAGVGANLQVAHTMVGLDFPWTPGDLLQGEDRVHRIGQTKKVVIYYLMAMKTIEERLMKLLQENVGVLNSVLNGNKAADEFDIYDQLLQEVND